MFLSLENSSTFLLAKEKTWKHIFNTNSELSQNCTEKQIMPSKTTINWLFNIIFNIVYDVIYSLFVLIEKLAFSKKEGSKNEGSKNLRYFKWTSPKLNSELECCDVKIFNWNKCHSCQITKENTCVN